ncbi:oxidoreductase [Terribacillus saccharophilus]|uniref:Oxidoreductase n=1 Tax=Terribacillus saccharophilus TaxID=361277 RepID=A0A268HG43_9BACI|nr:aldo/keto reductase [Terribacillus saccharophilus]PAE08831.1 oxidoreductase [Terribacillus saccharophilus]
MQKRRVGTSDLQVSEISFGTMSIGTDEQQGIRLLHEAQDLGINYFDTADLYDQGKNEEIVGKAFKGRRDKVILASKVGNRLDPGGESWHWDASKEYIVSQIKESLRRLQTDYLDLYQLHGGTMDDNIDETIDAFETLKKEGLIRYYGISSIRPNVIREYVKRSNIVSVMMQYSLLDRRPEEQVLDFLTDNNISVFARGSVAKGMLSEKASEKVKQKGADGYLTHTYEELLAASEKLSVLAEQEQTSVTSLTVRYVLQHPALASAVMGASSLEQVKQNAKLPTERLPDAMYEKLQQFTRQITYTSHR